jgi:hypothetical protein
MSRHPHLGVPKSKPRLPDIEPNGEPASKEEIAKLSEEYLRTRNSQMASKAEISALELARRRGELISKQLAFASLSYLLVCFRQRTLLAPRAIARRLVSLKLVEPENEHAVSEAIRHDIHALLRDLAHLPEKVTNPNWLAEFERENVGTGSERQQTPGEIKAQAAKAKVRAARKIETQRARREGRA